MAGGTLVVSRADKLYPFYKKYFEERGFTSVTITGMEKDALNMLIDDLRPKIVIIGAGFFQSAMVLMTSQLVKRHKGINFVIISTRPEPYPSALAMKCIVNGVKSFITITDGFEQFDQGIEQVKQGKSFISPSVLEELEEKDEVPKRSGDITEREIEVARLMRNGFEGQEIADELDISLRTVNYHKQEMYSKFGTRNELELVRVVGHLKLVNDDELNFYPRKYDLRPLPLKKKKKETGIRIYKPRDRG